MSIRSSCLWSTGVLLILLAWGAVLVSSAHGADEVAAQQGFSSAVASASTEPMKERVQAWLRQQYQPLLAQDDGDDLHWPTEDTPRYLALYHTVTGEIIPLFAQGGIEGESTHLQLPVSLSRNLLHHYPELAQNWLFVIANQSGQPLYLIDGVTDRGLDWPFFQVAAASVAVAQAAPDVGGAFDLGARDLGTFDLGGLDHQASEGMLGLVDLTVPHARPVILVGNVSPALEMAEVSAGLLRVLAALPVSQRDKLAFVVAQGQFPLPNISHLLMPLNSLKAIDPEDHKQNISLSLFAKHALLKRPDINNTGTGQGRRFELVIGPSTSTGRPIYHRLAAMVPIENWPQGVWPVTPLLTLSVRSLSELGSSPHLRSHSLAVVEHDPSRQRQTVYKLTSTDYGSVLYRILALSAQNQKQSGSALISFQLPTIKAESYSPPLPPTPTDPAVDLLNDVDLPQTLRRSKRIAVPAKANPKLVLRRLELNPRQITRTLTVNEPLSGPLTRIHPLSAQANPANNKPSQQPSNRPSKAKSPSPALVDNANNVFQAIRAQDERDRVMAKEATKQPTVQPPMAVDWGKGQPLGSKNPLSADSFGRSTAPRNLPKPQPEHSAAASKPKASAFAPSKQVLPVKGQGSIMDMSQLRAAQDAELAANLAQADTRPLAAAQDQDVRAPIAPQQLQLLPTQHPFERFGDWLGHYVIDHPVHTVGMVAGVISTLNVLRQWQSYPGVRDHLFNDTLALMPVNLLPMCRDALEVMVYGTPDNLLDLWSPDVLHWWVNSACERWCARTNCHPQQLSDVFVHYVLAPVTSDPRQLQQEIEWRITEQPIALGADPDTPWRKAVALRRQGLPAALDFNPVTRNEWLVELSDHGQLLDVHTQTDARHMPVKVLRRSFLETPLTLPHHHRYQALAKGSLTDVTNQYSRMIAPYPNERFRYGLYTCSTLDGDTWWVLDVADSKPGMHALPALTGFSHEQERGRCKVSTMDQWVSVLNEDGQISTLVPNESVSISVDIVLADLMAGVDEHLLTQDHCQVHYLQHRHWRILPVLESEPGVLTTQLPSQALYRLRCGGHTTLFTLNETQDYLDLWSWPEHAASSSQESHPLEPVQQTH